MLDTHQQTLGKASCKVLVHFVDALCHYGQVHGPQEKVGNIGAAPEALETPEVFLAPLSCAT